MAYMPQPLVDLLPTLCSEQSGEHGQGGVEPPAPRVQLLRSIQIKTILPRAPRGELTQPIEALRASRRERGNALAQHAAH